MAVEVVGAGVDTWSPCWYVEPRSHAGSMLDELATSKVSRGAALPQKVAGHTVGWNSAVGMLWAEGHPSPDGLCAPDTLPEALDRLVGQLDAHGVPVPPSVAFHDLYGGRVDGLAGIRRLDSTADVACVSEAHGLAIMAGVAALARDAPRSKAQIVYGNHRRAVETVYLRGHSGKRVLGRWYDKGIEAGTAPRGRLLRPEDQRRYTKGTRRAPEELTAAYVRSKFQGRFLPLWQASKGVTVAGPVVLAQKLQEAVDAGEVTPAQAELVAGHLLLEAVGGVGQARRTRFRRRALARELGLVLGDGIMQEVEINLHDVLDEILGSDAWTRSG